VRLSPRFSGPFFFRSYPLLVAVLAPPLVLGAFAVGNDPVRRQRSAVGVDDATDVEESESTEKKELLKKVREQESFITRLALL
jgi:hypothetical protein